MRSSTIVRLVSSAGLVLALFTGVVAASAQDATSEATPDQSQMMSQMMAMQGACPQGAAAMMMSNMATPEAGATMEASSSTGTGATVVTPEASMEMNMATAEATTGVSTTGTQEAMMGVTCLFGQFSGLAEVPGPGAPGASGFVFVSVDPASGNICYEEDIQGITLPAKATHIHVNSAGLSGDIVVPFPTPPDASGMASGCTTTTVAGLAQAIANNPTGYYVNVHTSDFPNGAARAQLSTFDMSMMSGMMTSTPESGVGSTSMSTEMPMTTPEATVGS
jgi:hypothetical protein